MKVTGENNHEANFQNICMNSIKISERPVDCIHTTLYINLFL